ncbi:MAG: hypothetical protein CMJ84_06350 [Planctomycetes bacterium]|nr:hypothetical protein [Planctomycetota bacterium]MDP6408303.1 hypothetical protein [Planctomycetota bacterium]
MISAGLSICLALGPLAQDASRASHEVRLERGREALEAGRTAEAVGHLQDALRWRPGSEEILTLLIEAAADAPDEAALWAHVLATAGVDPAGRSTLGREASAAVAGAAPAAPGLARARAAAVKELAELARTRARRIAREPARAVEAWWAGGLARELAGAAPRLLDSRSDTPGPQVPLARKLPAKVTAAVRKVMRGALTGGRGGEAARAALVLAGLGAQAGFDDLQDEPHSSASGLAEEAASGLAKARRMVARGLREPWSLEELEDLDEEQALAFTREHGHFANPARGLSPDGLYLVETLCGFETILGVVATVEDHHRRLAGWYGEDPFEGRRGLVRVVPESAGLEAENTPFWWAGGFQAGDLTVLKFSCGTIEGLGHGLTHELTHRFDGALFPGIPAWLAEGRAVWTGGAYGWSGDERFVDDYVSFGTVESAFIKGYGAQRNLERLIEGTIDDYRDNYVAGYALYVYLASWEEDGRRLFADRLEGYMRDIANGRDDPSAWFAERFADGAAGRPAGMEAFATGFGEFVRGFYWDSRAPWTSRYESSIDGVGGPWVYDEPTWTWERSRAEPYYGQDHARRAGELLAELGKEREAGEAFLWAVAVDERSPRRSARLAELLEELGAQGAAWCLRNEHERRGRRAGDGGGTPCPFARELGRTIAFLAALDGAVATADDDGRPLTARALAGEHDRWAAALGLPLSGRAAPAASSAAAGGAGVSIETPARLFASDAWVEDGLTGYEERRVRGLWYTETDGDLHVGRSRPREATGRLDRASHQRHAFARTAEWQRAGRYAVRARVRFTTSYVSAALVLGYTRRDRNLRVHLSAGDFQYAIGKKEESEEIEGVGWRVAGLRDRDGPLSGSLRGGRAVFDSPRAHFSLEAVVDGAALHLWIEGEHVGTYHTVDGQPIEGFVGFATGMGAIEVIEPTVQRLDRGAALGTAVEGTDADLAGLDLSRLTPAPLKALVNRSVRGLAPALGGTLVAWSPMPLAEVGEAADVEMALERGERFARRTLSLLHDAFAAQPVVLALSDLVPPKAREALGAELSEEYGDRVHVVSFAEPRLTVGPDDPIPGYRQSWLCFIDSAGILRFAERSFGFSPELPAGLTHWLRVFAEHRRGR